MNIRTRYSTPIMWVGVIIGIIILGWLLLYRSQDTIRVDDRWWQVTVTIGHNETTYTETCETDPETRKRTCTTTESTNWVTSCRKSSTGRELPPAPPVNIPCTDMLRREDTTYHLHYHKDDTTEIKHGTFDGRLWDQFDIGEVRVVEMTILDHVTKVLE